MTTNDKIRVATVDDHPLMHEGLAALINNQPDMSVVAEAINGRDAITIYREHEPDVVLMDLRLPDMTGVNAMAAILSEFKEARIIILTTFAGDADIQRALRSGARAYILKTSPPGEIVDVVRRVHAGKKHIPAEIAAQLAEHFGDEDLTEREVEVLRHVAEGNRNRDIAEQLFISEETVKVHVKHIMDKLGAADRTEAVAIGLRRGIIHL